MVNVNQTFIDLINSGSYIEQISGTLKNGSGVTVLNLENDFIENGSLTIDNKCINNKDLEPGAVYSAELKIAITAEAGLTDAQKSALQNGSLNLTYTVKDFETEETSASCALGIYYITAIELIDDETVITAEDLLSRMSRNITDEDRETLEANGFTPYELLLMAAEACSTAHRPITVANDEAEFDTWTNSAEVFMLPETADITTYRDLVAEVAAVLGCFATVDKATNGLILKRLNPHTNNNVYTVPDDLQFENTKSSYVCKTGKVYLGDNYFYPATEDDEVNGLILCMKKTQLTNDATQTETIVSGLYDEMSEYTYRPARILFLGNPALEAGDWIGVNYKLIDEEGEASEDVYTYRTIITHTLWEFGGKHLLEATGSSLATTKKIGSKGSNESRNSSSIDNLTNRIETLESSSGDAINITYDNTTSRLVASNVQSAIDEIAQDFQDGCDTISQAVIAKGQTPASNSPADIAYAISRIPTDYPRLQKVYSAYTDPIDVTYITDTGQYFVIAVMTSKPGVTTSSTDIVYFNGETTGRQTAFYIINCKAGDTITIKINNMSAGAYRGTTACILKNVGATVTSAVQDWKVFKFDSTATMGKVLSLDTIYLCVGGSCGEQHSSSFEATANLGSYYNSNCQESGINVSVINALSGTVNISQSQFGNIAGGVTVSGYILTV